MKRQIAIDFSTTTTAIAYQDRDGTNQGEVKLLKFEGADYVPTLILKEGSITNKKGMEKHHEEAFGWDAARAAQFHSLLQSNFKMGLIEKTPDIREESQKLVKKFFDYLYTQYNANAIVPKGMQIDDLSTIVTYPAKFSNEVQQFLKKAAMDAGFHNVELLDEAKAAMAYSLAYETGEIKNYIASRTGKKLTVMIIDMGAGTTDIAIFEYDTDDPANFVHLCSWPEKGGRNFGGGEIDKILCDFYKEKLGGSITKILGQGNNELGEVLLKNQIKEFKEITVSGDLNRGCEITELPGSLAPIVYSMSEIPDTDLDRVSFEALLKDYLPQFPELVKGALTKAELSGKNVDLVLLTGGHSQWYFVKEKLAELGIAESAIFGFPDPHLVVAQGAARYVEPIKKLAPKPEPIKPQPEPAVRSSESKDLSAPIQTKNQNGTRFTMIQLRTPAGDEPGRLVIVHDGNPAHIKIELVKRPFTVQLFELSEVRRKSGDNANELVLVSGAKEYKLLFTGPNAAEIWFNMLMPFSQKYNFESKTTKSKPFPMVYDPRSKIRPVIAANNSAVWAVTQIGTVLCSGYNTERTSNWRNIVAVAAGFNHIVGLRSDGTVVAAGKNNKGQCDVSSWKDIIAIAAGSDCTVGLRVDGTVVCAGRLKGQDTSRINAWREIAAIAVSRCPVGQTVVWGIRENGDCFGSEGTYRHFDKASIICGANTSSFPIVLSRNGTIINGGPRKWRNIVAVAADEHVVGLKSDGTVVADGPWNDHNQLNVSSWCNVIAVAAGVDCTVGLTSNGGLRLAYQKKHFIDAPISAKEMSKWKLF